jgi:hypothetical protein
METSAACTPRVEGLIESAICGENSEAYDRKYIRLRLSGDALAGRQASHFTRTDR